MISHIGHTKPSLMQIIMFQVWRTGLLRCSCIRLLPLVFNDFGQQCSFLCNLCCCAQYVYVSFCTCRYMWTLSVRMLCFYIRRIWNPADIYVLLMFCRHSNPISSSLTRSFSASANSYPHCTLSLQDDFHSFFSRSGRFAFSLTISYSLHLTISNRML
jgi:hypothetical protein